MDPISQLLPCTALLCIIGLFEFLLKSNVMYAVLIRCIFPEQFNVLIKMLYEATTSIPFKSITSDLDLNV